MSGLQTYLVLMLLCGIKADVTKSPTVSIFFSVLSLSLATLAVLEMFT